MTATNMCYNFVGFRGIVPPIKVVTENSTNQASNVILLNFFLEEQDSQ